MANRWVSFIAVSLLTVLIDGAVARADDGAAAYQAAFKSLPTSKTDLQRLKKWDGPIDDAGRKLNAKNDPVFAALHKGSASATVEWGRDYSKGVELTIPELNDARTLSGAVALRIRILCDGKKFDDAVTVGLDAMMLARRLGGDKLIVCRLVANGLEAETQDALAASIPVMPKPVLRRLAKDYVGLPPAGKASDAAKGDMAGIVASIKSGSDMLAGGGALPPDDAGRTALIEELDKLSEAIAKVVDLPPDQSETGVAKYDQSLANASTYARKLVIKPAKLMSAEQKMTERRALFAAGALVALDGPATRTADPFGGHPFEYKKSAEGFDLASTVNIGDKVSVMRFGPDALK